MAMQQLTTQQLAPLQQQLAAMQAENQALQQQLQVVQAKAQAAVQAAVLAPLQQAQVPAVVQANQPPEPALFAVS